MRLNPFSRYLAIFLALGATAVVGGPVGAQEADPGEILPPEVVEPAELEVSPRGAFLRSLVLPGWGQASVGAPARGTVYFAIEAGSLWMVNKSRVRLDDARARERFIREDPGLTGEAREALLAEIRPLRRSREDQVEDWATFAVFMLLLSAADAFVSAYLVDFDAQLGADAAGGNAFDLRVSVPVGK